MPKKDMKAISTVVHATLKKVVPPIVNKTTNDKKNLSKVIAEANRLKREQVKDDIVVLVADVDTFFQNYMNNHILHYKYKKIVPHVESCRVVVVHDRDHHDDARPEGESSAKRQKKSEQGTYTTGESSSSQAMDESIPSGSDDDEVPYEEVSPELLAEVSGKGMTSDDLQRMQDALNKMMRSQCDSGALAVLITGASQSRQHDKSESDLTSHLLQSLFDVGTSRISIITMNTVKYHSDVLARSQG
ncbi:hypothetical protein Tco_1209624 [Tanacetum coccineum]